MVEKVIAMVVTVRVLGPLETTITVPVRFSVKRELIGGNRPLRRVALARGSALPKPKQVLGRPNKPSDASRHLGLSGSDLSRGAVQYIRPFWQAKSS